MRAPLTKAMAGIACLVSAACADPEDREPPPPYTPPGVLDTAIIFGAGVISTVRPEFGVTFTPDGRTVYFNRTSVDRNAIAIMVSRFDDGGWAEPEVAPFSGRYRDVDPFITTDGARLYFNSNRPIDGADPKEDFDIWYLDREGDGWSDPINPGAPLNTDVSEVYVTATREGVLYYAAFPRVNGVIHRAEPVDGGWRVEALPRVVNGLAPTNPLIAPDERFLVLVAPPLVGGSVDLYVSYRREGGAWTEPTQLDAVNSRFADFAPALSPDGRYLFFTSERPGMAPAGWGEGRPPGDLYQIDLSAAGIEPDPAGR